MLFEAKGVRKRFGRVQALDGVSFGLEAGKTLGVVGQSGAGKSTLARLALGLLRPDEGEILFESKRLPERGRKRLAFCRQVQAVFQDPVSSLDPRMRIGSSLREPLAVHGVRPRSKRQEKIRAALSEVGLSELVLERFPRELSGGECQRIAIARAMLLEPRVLVCDEPVSSLDPILRAGVLNIFLRLQKEKGLALLFISHDLSVIRHMSDEVLVLHDGAACESGPAAEVFERPRHVYTQALLARFR